MRLPQLEHSTQMQCLSAPTHGSSKSRRRMVAEKQGANRGSPGDNFRQRRKGATRARECEDDDGRKESAWDGETHRKEADRN